MFHHRQRQRPVSGAPPRALAAGLALAIFTTPFLLGCASSGDGGERMGASRTGAASTQGAEAPVDPWAPLGYRLDWRGFPVLTRSEGVARVGVFDEGVLVQDRSNTVTLMDHDTGRNLWVSQVARPTARFVGNGVSGDRFLICTDNEIYFLDDQTGNLLDRQSLALIINTPPVVVGDIAVFGSATGELLGHSLVSGFKQWGYQLRGSIQAPPVSIGPDVGAVSQNGDVLIVDPATGASVGRANIFGGLENRPVADERTMYIASVDQSVYAFTSRDARRVWRHRTESPITAQPALVAGVLYVAIPGDGLVALDSLTGDVLWTNPDMSGAAVASLGDEVMVWDGSALHALDAETGVVQERLELPEATRVFAHPVEDGDLYVVTSDAVAKYSPR